MAGFGSSIKLTGESEYQRALKQINQSLREVSSEMKVVSSAYDKNDKSTQAIAQKSDVLNKKLEEQKNKLSILTQKYNEMNNTYGKNSTAQQQLTKELTKEKAELERIGNELGKTSKEYQNQQKVVDGLENKQVQYNNAVSKAKTEMNQAQAEINQTTKELDKLGKETKDTTDEVKKAGDGFTVFKGVLSNLATQGINLAINSLKKLGTALVSVGKQAIESYAEYEQLVGGVETLFKDSAGIVQKYAEQAYKTAGISANEYMQQATSFSASLLQGLGGDTKKAAQIADMAITDMSDNANKMGTSIEMIQNAYQGFAKQNYTMLDNLKLGYGGTKSEMARLVKESGILGKAGEDLTAKNLDQKVSFDQIIKAINITQQRMGITGTTAKEAASTIEGSVKSMKAAWKNLLTAIADDNKDISKSVNEFVDSAVTAAKNLVPRIKVSIDGIKKLINSIVTEVFPKLKKEIPELKPLIETFEWFIDHKSLIIGSIQAIIAAFAVNKILTFTKSLSDGAKGLLAIVKNSLTAAAATTANTAATEQNTIAQGKNTIAQTLGATATKGLASAQALLNAAWKSNPIGLIVTGVTAAIGVFSLFKKKTEEVTEAEKQQKQALEDQAQAIQNNKAAWEDLQKSRQSSIDAGMTEISHYEALWDELQGIVDQNGKVKKGYEQRASFITSTLSEALGIEINNVNGVIKKYDNLKKTIEEVMEKKKAQIILDAQESMYAEAIQKQGDAVRELNNIEQQLNDKRAERSQLEQNRLKLEAQLENELDSYKRMYLRMSIEDIDKKIAKNNEYTNDLESQYNEQEGLIQSYAYNIGQYEQNMALFHEGKYEEMTNVNWNYVKDYQKAEDAQKAMLEDQIKVTETNLNLLKQMKDKSGNDLYDSQIKAAEKQLAQQKESLKQYESTTKTGLDATKVQWTNGLDKILSTITSKNIEFKEDGKGNVQMYIDGVASGEKKSKDEMAKLVTNTIKEVTKKDKDAQKAGENLIDGVNNGIKNQNKQSSVFSSISKFGSSLLSKLKSSLQEKSPSKATKEMGQYLLEGLGIGISDEEGLILNQVSNVGKNVLSNLQNELNQNIKLGKIEDSMPNIKTSFSSNTYDSMVNAFKEALSEMKIELDDEVAGKFVENTVTRAIYS